MKTSFLRARLHMAYPTTMATLTALPPDIWARIPPEAPGRADGYPSGPPTDPYVRNSRIRFLKPTFKGVWYAAVNFAPLPLLDTRPDQCPIFAVISGSHSKPSLFITQKRHPQPTTPCKSESKGQCDTMAVQECLTPCPPTLFMALHPMVTVTSLPLFVTILFRGMPGRWKSRHRLVLCWLVVMQALFPGRKPWEDLAPWPPASITAWRFRRVLKATDWDVHLLVEWWVQEALTPLPPPKDGVLYVVGDGSEKPKRGTQNPLAQKGRKSEQHPWFFGIRFALLIVNWDVSRLPVALRLLRPKSHPAYQPEHALCREMVGRFVPPPWAKRVIVEGDAASGSQDNRKMVMQRDAADPVRRWGFVCAIARTCKTGEDKAIKDVVPHLPRKY